MALLVKYWRGWMSSIQMLDEKINWLYHWSKEVRKSEEDGKIILLFEVKKEDKDEAIYLMETHFQEKYKGE